jgi:hypothetical protein
MTPTSVAPAPAAPPAKGEGRRPPEEAPSADGFAAVLGQLTGSEAPEQQPSAAPPAAHEPGVPAHGAETHGGTARRDEADAAEEQPGTATTAEDVPAGRSPAGDAAAPDVLAPPELARAAAAAAPALQAPAQPAEPSAADVLPGIGRAAARQTGAAEAAPAAGPPVEPQAPLEPPAPVTAPAPGDGATASELTATKPDGPGRALGAPAAAPPRASEQGREHASERSRLSRAGAPATEAAPAASEGASPQPARPAHGAARSPAAPDTAPAAEPAQPEPAPTAPAQPAIPARPPAAAATGAAARPAQEHQPVQPKPQQPAEPAPAAEAADPAAPTEAAVRVKPARPGDVPRGHLTLHEAFEAVHGLLRVARGEGFASARISLTPPELGKLEIRLSFRGGRLTAEITADTAEAVQALGASATDLRRSLEAAGVAVHDLSITHAGPEERSPADGRSGEEPRNGGRPATTGDGPAEDEPETVAEVALAPGSTLDVLA